MPPRDGSIPQPWPAVSPDQTNDIELFICWRGPEMTGLGFTRYPGFTDVFKPHPVENILPGRKTFEQQL